MKKLIGQKYWTCSYTLKWRYHALGITDQIYDYAKKQNREIKVIDVGCSDGSALHDTVSYLSTKNLEVHAVGIDISEKNKILKNKLDEFINKDVLDVDDYDNTADIVICSRVIRHIDVEVKYSILKKCESFLRPSGILIFDTIEYKNNGHDENLFEPKAKSMYYEDNPIEREKQQSRQPNDTMIIRKENIKKYAIKIHSDWNKLNRYEKIKRKLDDSRLCLFKFVYC